ncbi:MAG TPA: hypothetical protein VG538_16245 [Vicinamibacterales bacterium]|jgi:hypothetical protein|nr:hypothetical protein [Vicinamibacterales bacterium]
MAIRFGLYPGSACGDDAGHLVAGPRDDVAEIHRALDALEDHARTPLLVRAYTTFSDERGADATDILTPSDALHVVVGGRALDLVAQYQSRAADVDGYARFVRHLVRRYGAITATLQITEEPNVRGNAVLDGDYPDVLGAIVAGIAAATDEARARGFGHIQVGVNTTPLFGPSRTFYEELAALGGGRLVESVAYVGLDMFPDVFRPVPGGDVRAATRGLLTYHRHEVLAAAGLGHLPIRITEHGWPTGADRSLARQADVLRDVIETVASVHEELNVAAYELFSLRDAESSGRGLYHHFGIMTDAYRPKPAFEVFRRLIAKYS